MARISWFDKDTDLPVIEEQVGKLESFTNALADGVVERMELEAQQERLMGIMREVEPSLSDEQHEKVTRLLVELSAYNIMRLLHELQAQRLHKAFGH